jgi:hypothetical protein
MTAARGSCVEALRVLAMQSGDDPVGNTVAVARARRHLDSCPRCGALLDDTGSGERALARLEMVRPARFPVVRGAMGVLAAVQCILALPWLFGIDPLASLGNNVTSAHLTRDGAIGIIVGVAGLATALRPRHAVAMLIMAIVSIVMQAFTVAIDGSNEHVGLVFELLHALIPVIVVLIGVVAFRRPRPVGAPDRSPGLHIVR